MCGRGACTLKTGDYLKALREKIAASKNKLRGGEATGECNTERFNIPPGSSFPIVLSEGNDCILHTARWGLSGIGGKGYLVNARGETVHEKPTFKNLQRCVLTLTGYFEWEKSNPKQKQPYYFTQPDGDIMPLAALFNKEQNSYIVITTAVHPDLAFVHDRMPVILDEEGLAKWLSPTIKLSDCNSLLRSKKIKCHPVTKNVGKTAYNSPNCVSEIDLNKEKSPKKSEATLTTMWGKAAGKKSAPTEKRERQEEIIITDTADTISVNEISDDDDVMVIDAQPTTTTTATNKPSSEPTEELAKEDIQPRVKSSPPRNQPEDSSSCSVLAERLRNEYLDHVNSVQSSSPQPESDPTTQPVIKRPKND
eukprot:TRINITY_DN3064_c0_g1_i1.p1 TRINITY_DN3064_c0_g1~~TRINITY_DN3064_c0_g1_i1.p1  ORF type:complete len:365 (+),score=76.29 TRINITY_DN3064_c0_g1_i1:129-1223(+)